MANKRSLNIVNQQRIDVPDLRSIESATRNDFDELFNSLVLGESNKYVVRGLELQITGSTVNSSANNLQLVVANSSILHGASNVSGTFLTIPTGTPNETLNPTINTKIVGSFTPNAVNYIGIELDRAVDQNSKGSKYIWNQSSASEFIKILPLSEVLDYKIHITSSIFAANIMPIATVLTDGSNNVKTVEDRRPMLLRLATSGSQTPNPNYNFPWTDGRVENPNQSSTSVSPFKGGDKQLTTLKDWMDAVSTSIKEINGGAFWYSQPIGGSIVNLRNDLGNSYISGSGTFIHSNTVGGQINWSGDFFINLITSTVSYKILSNAATTDISLADGDVAYITLVRGVDIIPNIKFTQGSPVVDSVGGTPWTSGLLAGDYVKVASELDNRYYEILSVDSASQVTLTSNYLEASTGLAGIQAKYAYGSYLTNATPSTNRHVYVNAKNQVPFGEDVYWLFSRKDDSNATALVYVRNGNQLQKGETITVIDNATQQMIQYIGAQSSVQSIPDYLSKGVSAGSLILPNYNASVNDDLAKRSAKLTAMIADLKQDLNIEFNSGSVAWDGANLAITGMSLSIPGATIGAAPIAINNYPTTAFTPDDALYVDINRSTAGVLTVTKAQLSTLTPSQQRLILVRRIGADIWIK